MHTPSEDTFRWRAYQQELSCIGISIVHPGRGEDTRILLHVDNETVQGHSKACDRTLAVTLLSRLGSRDTLAIRATGGLL